jgi:osmotically-inducible protein OsmY
VKRPLQFDTLTRGTAAALALCGALAGLPGCVPLILGGAVVGTGLVVTDRRTTGTQVEDESIELKAGKRSHDLATLGQVSIYSYNRLVLITGRVPGETEKKAVEAAVAQVENVRNVVNELAVGSNLGVGTRSADAVLVAKVRATLVDAKDVQANAFKVVVEAGTVYLMGRVTEREAGRAVDLVRSIAGVQKVVRVFEILSEAELAALGRPAPAPTSK